MIDLRSKKKQKILPCLNILSIFCIYIDESVWQARSTVMRFSQNNDTINHKNFKISFSGILKPNIQPNFYQDILKNFFQQKNYDNLKFYMQNLTYKEINFKQVKVDFNYIFTRILFSHFSSYFI